MNLKVSFQLVCGCSSIVDSPPSPPLYWLVGRDVWLSPVQLSEGEAALLKLRFGVIPVLVQDEVLLTKQTNHNDCWNENSIYGVHTKELVYYSWYLAMIRIAYYILI